MRDYKVYYGIPTYTEWERAEQAVLSIIHTSTLVPDEFVIMDNSENGSAVLALQKLIKTYTNVHVIPRAKNNLSGAWNDIMNLYCDDYIIIANDDVTPTPYSIESLVNTARANPKIAMVTGIGGNSYSYFLLRKWAYAQLGPFDEGFDPAYFEDNDFDYRLRILAGLERIGDPNATFTHYGSATMKHMNPDRVSLHHMRFAANRQRYIQKWGGIPEREVFKIPFQFSPTDLDDD